MREDACSTYSGIGLLEYATAMRRRTPKSKPGETTTEQPEKLAPHSAWCHDVVRFSSQLDDAGFGAHQLVGPPRTYPIHGHVDGAWQPSPAAAGSSKPDWVEIKLERPMRVVAIELYETFHPGACVSISLWSNGPEGWDPVWQGDAQQASLPAEARIFAPPLERRSYDTQFLRIELTVASHPSFSRRATQIDAVRVSGHWASEAGLSQKASPKQPKSPSAMLPEVTAVNLDNASARVVELEGLLHSERTAHRREVEHLRSYIYQLRRFADGLRTELDAARASAMAHA